MYDVLKNRAKSARYAASPKGIVNRRMRYMKYRVIIDRLKHKPCADCQGWFEPCQMDFDHRDASQKLFDIGKINHFVKNLLAEVAKCDVICANCHRLRTLKRGQYEWRGKQALLALDVGLRPDLQVKDLAYGRSFLWVFGPTEGIPDGARQRAIAILTPLVGAMSLNGRDWNGSNEELVVGFPHAQFCKVLGFKRVTKTMRREVEREPEFEEVEEEVEVPITDCDIKAGRAFADDIEVQI